MASINDYLKAAYSGGSLGGAIGGLGGPIGLGVGAGLGALGGLAGQYFGGDSASELVSGNRGIPGRFQQIQKYTPAQQAYQNQALQAAMSGLGDFSPIEREARRGFEQQTIPSIAERFTALGGGGGRASGLGTALGGAGADLESQLAAMRANFLQNQANIGLTPQFDTAYFEPQQGTGGGLMQYIPQLIQLLSAFQGMGGGSSDTLNNLLSQLGPNPQLGEQINQAGTLFGS